MKRVHVAFGLADAEASPPSVPNGMLWECVTADQQAAEIRQTRSRPAHVRRFGEIVEGHCRTLLHRVSLFCLIWEGGQMASAKEQMLEVLRNQPDDSSYNELLRELAFVQMVERGLADSDAGRTISHEDMLSRIRSWQR